MKLLIVKLSIKEKIRRERELLNFCNAFIFKKRFESRLECWTVY